MHSRLKKHFQFHLIYHAHHLIALSAPVCCDWSTLVWLVYSALIGQMVQSFVIGLLCSDWSDAPVCCDWSTLLDWLDVQVCWDWSTLLWLIKCPCLLWLVYSALIGQTA